MKPHQHNFGLIATTIIACMLGMFVGIILVLGFALCIYALNLLIEIF